MKRIIINLICLSCIFLSTHSKAQNDMELTNREKYLSQIAACEAKGDIEKLKEVLNKALEDAVTISEAKEALSQLYAYTGFPRSLNSLGALQLVISEREKRGLVTQAGKEADPLPKDYDALKRGTQVQTKLTGVPFDYTFAPQTDYYLKAHLFGDIFARNNLSFADREIVTVSAISCLPGCEPQLRAHIVGAKNMGVSDSKLKALPCVIEGVAGKEDADRLRSSLAEVYSENFHKTQFVDFDIWPKGEPNIAYAKYFTGNSYLAVLDGGIANVTFEPGCRNFWHIHHKQVQVLVCVAGRGWYQEWGKPAVEMVPGVIIAIPSETKHWHGAAKDSWFQHLTYHTNVEEGASNEWLEEVSDEIYNSLK